MIAGKIDPFNRCAVRCTRIGCSYEAGLSRHVHTNLLLNKAHAIIYMLVIFRQACRKCRVLGRIRELANKSALGGIMLSQYYVDAPSLPTSPDPSPNLHDLYVDLHVARVATWE